MDYIGQKKKEFLNEGSPYFPAVLPIKMIAAFSFESKEAVFNCFRYSRATRNEDVRLVSMVVLQRSSDISHK